jgi:hypothetical protein
MTMINGLYAMTPSHVAIAAQHLHNNVRPGKWLYQRSDETITPTLLAEIIRLKIGDCSGLVFHKNGTISGTSFETINDPDIMPMILVVAFEKGIDRAAITAMMWRLWDNEAFKRHTVVFTCTGISDPALINRVVKFAYQPEKVAEAA